MTEFVIASPSAGVYLVHRYGGGWSRTDTCEVLFWDLDSRLMGKYVVLTSHPVSSILLTACHPAKHIDLQGDPLRLTIDWKSLPRYSTRNRMR